jgi:peptidoglycan/LPS O-acetylase OafA/YrhL
LQGARYFSVMLAGVLACSLLFYLLIDQPMERLRRRVRQRARASAG